MTQIDPNGVELRDLSDERNQQRPVNKNGEASAVPASLRSSITAREPATTYTHFPRWPLVLFIVYASLTLVPWVTLCVMNRRPIRGTRSYYADGTQRFSIDEPPEYWYSVSKKHFRVMQILQHIAAIATIPVTTAICSTACVAYMQSGSLRRSLTLKQSMALADAGWIFPRVLVKVKTLGSLPLYTAFALTLIGKSTGLQVDCCPVCAIHSVEFSTQN